jgi:hypothetical protein
VHSSPSAPARPIHDGLDEVGRCDPGRGGPWPEFAGPEYDLVPPRPDVVGLIAAGFAVCRPDPLGKRPTHGNWTTGTLAPTDFPPATPVGIIAGPVSDGNRPGHALVVVDLDDPAALARADDFLPATAMIDGRAFVEAANGYAMNAQWC